MLKVPLYNSQNYRAIIGKDYSMQDLSSWIDLSDIIGFMSDEFIKKYEAVSSQDFLSYISANKSSLSSKVKLSSWREETQQTMLMACKYLMPTLWNCEYFIWKAGSGKHHWIDLILPKWTPLPSFVDGEVVKVKSWDWKTKNEWNCIVIKSTTKLNNNTIYLCYEHMDSISVQMWAKVKKWDIVWKCGSTWNSTQYHLHFQVDLDYKFHPFWSAELSDVSKYTINPFFLLRDVFSIKSNINVENNDLLDAIENTVDKKYIIKEFANDWKITDLPAQSDYKQAILWLYSNWIIKTVDWKVNPQGNLLRYEFALLISRILERFSLVDDLEIVNNKTIEYSDVDKGYQELMSALQTLWKYGIMKWKDFKFMPYDNLTWEQTLAVLWRLFFWLLDSDWDDWSKNYLEYFRKNDYISWSWSYKTLPIPRQESFRIIAQILINKSKI